MDSGDMSSIYISFGVVPGCIVLLCVACCAHSHYKTLRSKAGFRLNRSLLEHWSPSSPKPPAAALVELTRITLTARHIIAILPDTFLGLGNLQELVLDQNRISGQLEPTLFTGLTGLQVLRLESNQITAIHAHTFRGLVNLRKLWLHKNSLSGSLEPQLFAGLGQLRSLWLSGNRLSVIVAGTFDGLLNLQELFLNQNELSGELSATSLFKDLVGLDSLDLSGNQLTGITVDVGCSLKALAASLRSVWLSANKLTTLDPRLFKDLTELQTLYLDHNELSSLHADLFRSLSKLQSLDLAANKLTDLAVGQQLDLTGCVNLKVLKLSENALTAPLPAHLFKSQAKLEEVHLTGNAGLLLLLSPTIDARLFDGLNPYCQFKI
jgi:Leucine-rich repeat (LRR) protein